MANFYVILYELEKPKFDAHIEGILLDQKKEVIPDIFNKGRSLTHLLRNQFYVEKDDDYSKTGKHRDKLSIIINSSTPLFVASRNLESLLNEIVIGQVEFFNLTILDKGVGNSDFRIVNIVNKVDCINYEESELGFEFYEGEEPSGDITSTYKLVLREARIPAELSIFLLDRYKEAIVVVNEKLRKAISERELSGLVFCKIEDFQN